MKKITCNDWEYLQIQITYKDSLDLIVLDSCDEILLGEYDITIIKSDTNEVISINKQLILKHFITTHKYNHCLNVEWLDKNDRVISNGTIYFDKEEDLNSRKLIHLKRAQKMLLDRGISEFIKKSRIRNYS